MAKKPTQKPTAKAIPKAGVKNNTIEIKKVDVDVPRGNSKFIIPNWAPFAIMMFTGIIYLRALQNGITYQDDDVYILFNPYIKDFSLHGVWAIFTSFHASNYHPFTTLTNLIEYKLFVLNPLPYHLVNVLLHLLNTWLVYIFVNHLSGKKITALVVCILFAIHPMHVESVAWLAERKDVLYAAFYLGSLITYLRYLESKFNSKYYIFTILLFISSLLSKSAAVTLPVLLIAIDIYKARKINIKSLFEKVPFLFLSILFGILALKSQKVGGAMHDFSTVYNNINRLFVFTSGLVSYFIMLVFPVRLSATHFYPNEINNVLPWTYYLSIPSLIILIILVLKKDKYQKEKIFGFVFFIITISVMLQIIPVGMAFFAERYSYIPYIGLFYIAGQWISYALQRNHRKPLTIAGTVIIILLSFQTWNRLGVWRDTKHVFADIIEKNKGNFNVCWTYNYWALVKEYEGNNNEALQLYTNSILIDSNNYSAYTKRGAIYETIGNPALAIKDYDKAILLNPKVAENYNLRGFSFFELHDTTSAIRDYNKAILLDPGYAEAYNNRGWVFIKWVILLTHWQILIKQSN